MLIGTWTIGRTDPRLFDEALSWCCRFGDLIHQKRLKKCVDRVDDEAVSTISAAWGRAVETRGDVNWDTAAVEVETSGPERGLFVDENLDEQLNETVAEDGLGSLFLSAGWRREPFSPGDGVRSPNLTEIENAQLFCRRFFGMGVRAEVASLLFFGLDLTTSEFAEVTRYSQRSAQTVLKDLKQTEILDWQPGRGRTTSASLSSQFRKGFRRAVSVAADNANERPQIVRNWVNFYSGLVPLWNAVLEIERNDYEGFKAQTLLHEALEEAFALHCRTSIHAPYRPTLNVESFDALIAEANRYCMNLFPSDGSAP